jgi:nickel/cobalt transporter (NicO) family protein
VYLLGVVTLYASRYVVPERLYPWLGVLSGLVITGVGCALLLRRYVEGAATLTHRHTHGHGHMHAHGHTHAHTHGHTHGHAPTPNHSHHHDLALEPAHIHAHGAHQHHQQPGETVSFRELLALGVTGGIVPCPAALVVLLSAIALQRIGFGLLLIIAFSVGLATVLMAIGLLTVYARHFMSRFQGEGLFITRWLPLMSAAIITVLGLAMVIHPVLAPIASTSGSRRWLLRIRALLSWLLTPLLPSFRIPLGSQASTPTRLRLTVFYPSWLCHKG